MSQKYPSLTKMVEIRNEIEQTIKKYEENTGDKIIGINESEYQPMLEYYGIKIKLFDFSSVSDTSNYFLIKDENSSPIIIVDLNYAEKLKNGGLAYWNTFLIKRFIKIKYGNYKNLNAGTVIETGIDDTIKTDTDVINNVSKKSKKLNFMCKR